MTSVINFAAYRLPRRLRRRRYRLIGHLGKSAKWRAKRHVSSACRHRMLLGVAARYDAWRHARAHHFERASSASASNSVNQHGNIGLRNVKLRSAAWRMRLSGNHRASMSFSSISRAARPASSNDVKLCRLAHQNSLIRRGGTSRADSRHLLLIIARRPARRELTT